MIHVTLRYPGEYPWDTPRIIAYRVGNPHEELIIPVNAPGEEILGGPYEIVVTVDQ